MNVIFGYLYDLTKSFEIFDSGGQFQLPKYSKCKVVWLYQPHVLTTF